MIEHTLWTVLNLLIQKYCATADCVTGDCARLCSKRYYCISEKEKNTTNCAYNTSSLSPEGHSDLRSSLSQSRLRQDLVAFDVAEDNEHDLRLGTDLLQVDLNLYLQVNKTLASLTQICADLDLQVTGQLPTGLQVTYRLTYNLQVNTNQCRSAMNSLILSIFDCCKQKFMHVHIWFKAIRCKQIKQITFNLYYRYAYVIYSNQKAH